MDQAGPALASRQRPAIWVVALLVVSAALAAAIWWGTDGSRGPAAAPVRLHPFPSVTGTTSATARIGQPLLLSTGSFPAEEVVLSSAVARIRQNDAGATINVVLCAGKPEQGAYAETAERHCDRVLPISGAVLSSDSGGGRQLMLEVVPQRAGQVSIDGIDVTFRLGGSVGSQATGQAISVSTR